MRKRQLNDKEIIIFINNKYYVVNKDTLYLIEKFKLNSEISCLSKEIELSKHKTIKIYKRLSKKKKNVKYYDNNIELEFPLKIQWNITNRCNLKCKHCYLGNLNNQQLSSDELYLIADRLINSNVIEVGISGGEALLVEDLPYIVYKLISNDIKVNIFTNGLFLKKFENKLVSIMKKTPIDDLRFSVSIDGLKQTHDMIRGKGTYDKIMNNLTYIINRGYLVTTNTVLSELNCKEVPELYELLHSMGVYKIQIANLIDSGRANKSLKIDSISKKMFINELQKVLIKIGNDRKLLFAEIPDGECDSDVYWFDKYEKKFLQKEQWKCSAGIGKATIDYDGTMYCCPFMKKYSLGNILDKSLSEIWSSKNRYEFLRELAKNNNNSRVCIVAKKRL